MTDNELLDEIATLSAEYARRLKAGHDLFPKEDKTTRHGLAEQIFMFETIANGKWCYKLHPPDFLVVDEDGPKLVEIKNNRPLKGREKISEEQKFSHQLLRDLFGIKVEVIYVDLPHSPHELDSLKRRAETFSKRAEAAIVRANT